MKTCFFVGMILTCLGIGSLPSGENKRQDTAGEGKDKPKDNGKKVVQPPDLVISFPKPGRLYLGANVDGIFPASGTLAKIGNAYHKIVGTIVHLNTGTTYPGTTV